MCDGCILRMRPILLRKPCATEAAAVTSRSGTQQWTYRLGRQPQDDRATPVD